MRKLIVSNLVSLDGYYEGKDRNLDALFDYLHEDYFGDESFRDKIGCIKPMSAMGFHQT